MSAKQDLVAATKELLWEHGYESMSPTAIMQRSRVGQGSLYHHFRGKADLAATALAEIGELVNAGNDQLLCRKDHSAFENLTAHLTATRSGNKGCWIGRYANENEVVSNSILAEPIQRYFERQLLLIEDALRRAQQDGDIALEVPVNDVAICLAAVIQGGYNLSRLHNDDSYLERAARGAVALLQTYRACDHRRHA